MEQRKESFLAHTQNRWRRIYPRKEIRPKSSKQRFFFVWLNMTGWIQIIGKYGKNPDFIIFFFLVFGSDGYKIKIVILMEEVGSLGIWYSQDLIHGKYIHRHRERKKRECIVWSFKGWCVGELKKTWILICLCFSNLSS